MNWRLEIWPFILALSRELKELTQNYKSVNCIAEFLTQTIHQYYCSFCHIMLLVIKIKFVVKIKQFYFSLICARSVRLVLQPDLPASRFLGFVSDVLIL